MKELGRRSITRVAGTTIHWVELGQGKPLVLLHGVCDTHQTWRRVAPELARDRRLLIPDLPGHGLSGRPDAPYDLEWYADMIGQWVDHVELEELDLVGHSYGGGIAMHLLLSHAERIRRLALVSSGGLGREVTFGLRLLSLPLAEKLVQPWLCLGTRTFLWALEHKLFDAQDRRWHAWINGAPGSGRALTRTVRGVIGLRGQHRHFTDRLHEVEEIPPVALYWGDRDRILPFKHAQRAGELLRGVSVTRFPGCGHFPHLEQPGRFVASLNAFLENEALERSRVTVDVQLPARASWLRRAFTAVKRRLRSLWPPNRKRRRPKALLTDRSGPGAAPAPVLAPSRRRGLRPLAGRWPGPARATAVHARRSDTV